MGQLLKVVLDLVKATAATTAMELRVVVEAIRQPLQAF